MFLPKLQFLKRDEIDDKSWDDVIENSSLCRIYAYTWYLDAMTKANWSGLIIGDYEFVMPVYSKKKLFLPYVTQPFLSQQLGIFGYLKDLTPEIEFQFIYFLKTHYVKTDILVHSKLSSNYNHEIKQNHILPLRFPYLELKDKYNRNTLRNIKEPQKQGLNLTENTDNLEFYSFLEKTDKTGLVQKYGSNIKRLIATTYLKKNQLIISTKDNHGVNAAAYLIFDKTRIYFLLCASNKIGIENKSMFLIIDYIIEKYAEKFDTLDFTGSNIDSIARRNLGFGAQIENYYHYKFGIGFW